MLKNDRGFIAIESIIVVSAMLFFMILFISFFSYTLPRTTLEKEVQSLAQIAKKQGGLTDKKSQPVNSDVELFKDNLEKYGYDRDKIEITAKTIPSGNNAIGVTPLNSKSNSKNYIGRQSKELIEVIVKIPADKSHFDAPLRFFGIKNTLNDVYVFREVVGSERW